MALDDEIFVARPDAIELEVEPGRVVDLGTALAEAAVDATEVTILGGYYGPDWIVALLAELPKSRRPGCRVRIAVGSVSKGTLPLVWEDMRSVHRRIAKRGFERIEISVLGSSPVHFHTKLFRFVRTTRPTWFVGSANPGSKRHELMVRISGRHAGLARYVAAVFAAANPIEGQPPAGDAAADLREFLLNGMLCNKPARQPLFTFQAYRLSADDRSRMDNRIGAGAGVPHASPSTEGFGFGLRSAIGRGPGIPGVKNAADPRVGIRSSSMDTLFGSWVPHIYAKEAIDAASMQETANAIRLADIGQRLGSADGQAAARDDQSTRHGVVSIDTKEKTC